MISKTNYTKKQSRGRGPAPQNDKVVIGDIEFGINDIISVTCPTCMMTMHIRYSNLDNGSGVCLHCASPYNFYGARRKGKLITPRSRSNETNISHTPEPGSDNVRIRHELPLEWGAKSLSQKGIIRFVNYSE
jgi:hypothetical protein